MTLEAIEAPEALQVHDAEISLLGAALMGADIDELATIVDASDFWDPWRRDVWLAILRVHNAGTRPDAVNVRTSLMEVGDKGDAIELHRMTSLVPLVANADVYATSVAMAAGLRAIGEAGTQLHQLAAKPGDLAERREQARQLVDQACRGRHLTQARRLGEILPAVLDTAQHGATTALATPWPDLDELIDGLAPGRLLVVGARPGVGKSILGCNLALHVADTLGHAAHIASMEMPEDEVVRRLIAARASVNLTKLTKGGAEVDEASWERIAEAHTALDAMALTIDDAPQQTVQHVRKIARDAQRTREDLALIVVDYLQLMTTTSTTDNRAQALGEVSRGLKLLARETGACVIGLAQVNREASKRNDRPRMSDLRESGAIEADADQVLLLHQPDDDIPELEVIVDKNRHGPKGIRSLHVWGHYARLASVARHG